ncbi:cell division protein ZapE [Novosphingobium sp.]|uniref:cell division protein ZapE n=1 Tax=Novosphingobium sp. TaxID=1874826 RepID=UPI0025D85705|nr:cell division protein ZapE [Novosphingobium sp.]
MRIIDAYNALVSAKELHADAEQKVSAERLTALQVQLENPVEKSFVARLIKRNDVAPRGVYLWGGVGRGKSMLMDLFHQNLAISEKRRVHFHAFMLGVHQSMRKWRDIDPGDPIPKVAAELASKVRCLAFDELVVNNSADAMIMSRLFTALIRDEGVALVSTSNREPSELYKNGLNREHFLPFIALIERELDVLPLNGPVDYRMQRLAGIDVWHTPLGDAATAEVREAFFRLTDYPPEDSVHVPSADLELGGERQLHVPKSLKGVAVFSFRKLCGEARGAADYLAVAQTYHTVILVGIPYMGPENRNEAARFVTLIDALYENKVKLFVTAAADPEDLYIAGDGHFEFNRTVSRLNEMQSAKYLAAGHGVD